jgi:predicted ribonuclease toxin of YeeF-YezG toxin-antitoxin module
MAKTTQFEIDTTGRAAQVHLREIKLTKEKNQSYNLRRRNATELLRPMLKKIWAALEEGMTVNGCTTKEQWARWFNPGTRHPDRWIQKVIAGPKANSVRVTELVVGGVYRFKGVKYTVEKAALQSHTIHLIVEPVEEPKIEEKTAPTGRKVALTHEINNFGSGANGRPRVFTACGLNRGSNSL